MVDKDALFDELSKEFPPGKYTTFCNKMGTSYNEAKSVLTRYKENYNVALRDLLSQWDLRVKGVTRKQIEDALDGADVGGLCSIVDKHYEKASIEVVATTRFVAGDGAVHGTRSDSKHTNQEDIYSKKISDSLTVQRCREKLKNKYLKQLCKIQMKPWDHTDYAEFEDMHTVVTMVKKDPHGQGMNKKEILKGSVTDIFSTKVNGELPARILISAPAGRGKTTAVAKMAYDWVHREEGSALEHLPLLFVVKFRNTSQLTSIGEAIKSQLLSDVDDLTPEGLESFIRNNQGICHIILDGLDEYAGISSSKRSSESNIVNVIRWEEFPECRVLVTTRPHLENFFDQDDLPRVYTKMWIEGFSRESSCDYITKFFASTSKPCNGQILKDYLDKQPLIDELVKTPLFCLMICHVWSEGLLDSGTTTQTELLDKVNVFLMHHANERSKSRQRITSHKLKEIIYQLGEVALTGLLDDAKKLVFTPHDFREVPAILETACELGIVSKTIVTYTRLPQSIGTTSSTIEFYHKLAQEHSAGKSLADRTRRLLLPLKMSKLDRVLRKIKANIGDYENLIRFAAGTDNSLCIRIMEALLSNRFLDESERYRILLDCSSETKGTEENVSLLVQRCVNAQSIFLKSPTVYTVVGMRNLPKQLKREVKTVKFEGSTLTADVTSGLWSCLGSYPMLDTLNISDSSLIFPLSPPELPSVTKLSAERVTSQTYEGLLSSLPRLEEIDIIIGDEKTENITQVQTILRRHLTGQSLTRIDPHSFPSEENISSMSRKRMKGLGLLITECQVLLSGVVFGLEDTVIDVVQSSTRLMSTSLYFEQLFRLLNSDEDALNIDTLEIKDCQLPTEMTVKLWSCLKPFTSLKQLSIADSSLSFPPSLPKLLSVTKVSAKTVTSQSYEAVLSSVPGVREIEISIDDAETRNFFQINPASRPMGQARARDEQLFVQIKLHAWQGLTTDREIDSVGSIGRLSLLFDQTRNQGQGKLRVSGVKGRDEEALVDIFVKTKQLTYLNSKCRSGGGSQNKKYAIQNTKLQIQHCQLSTEMTEKLWSCLRSFNSLEQLSIADSSLSFPPSPPKLPSVIKLSAKRVTSQRYKRLLSSFPRLRDIVITFDDAEREIARITAGLRYTGGQQLKTIRLEAATLPPSEKTNVSRETMRGLGLLIRKHTKNLQWLGLSGIKCLDEVDLVELVESSASLKSLDNLHLQSLEGGSFHYDRQSDVQIKQCLISTEMTARLWSCLRSFTSLNHLTISDSSLSFPSSPPELPSVTKLSAERVTSQSYDGLLSSLPGLRMIDITIDDAERDIPQITAGLRRTTGQQLTSISLTAPSPLPSEKKSVSSETMRGLGLLIREQQKDMQWLCLSGVKCRDEEDLVELVESCGHVNTLSHLMLLGCGTNTEGRLRRHITGFYKSNKSLRVIALHDDGHLFVEKCNFSSEMTIIMWSCLRSFTSPNHLTISDSSLSFPSYPPVLPSVTKLSAERVTSHGSDGLLSSLTGLNEIDITVDDAERDIPQITAGLRRTGGQQLTHIKLTGPLSSEEESVSRETMRGLGLLIREQTKKLQWLCLSRVKCRKEENLIELVETCRHVKTMKHLMLLGCGTAIKGRLRHYITGLNKSKKSLRVIALHDGGELFVEKCQLSTEITARLWSCLRSFTSLDHITISDSCLSFPQSPSELLSVTQLSAKGVTSQSYVGLLSSLPRLDNIDIDIGDVERDVLQITAGLRLTGGQQLTQILLRGPISTEEESVSSETMKELSLLIREQTKNLELLTLSEVECTDEEDLVYLIECCRHVETMSNVLLSECGTKKGGRLESYLRDLQTSSRGDLTVEISHGLFSKSREYEITNTD